VDELTEAQIQELAGDLRDLQTSLKSLLESSKGSTRAVEPDPAIGRLTRMDAIQQQSMAKANRATYQIRLQQVEQALRMIAEDDYGYCRRCEEDIGYRRLKAKPETPFCVGCQSASEGA
jgi:DnaK suppressor protein